MGGRLPNTSVSRVRFDQVKNESTPKRRSQPKPVVLSGAVTAEDEYHVAAALTARRAVLDRALGQLSLDPAAITDAARLLVRTLAERHKVLAAGNGGSAAEAQHFAAELVGRFKKERNAYAVVSLVADSSVLTALGNDYGYSEVFARQVEALGSDGDLLIAFSTSGESENLIRAAEAARRFGLSVIAVTGGKPNRLERLADVAVRMPALDVDAIQELQTVATHILCGIAEAQLSPADGSSAR